MGLQARMFLLAMFVLRLLTWLYLRSEYLLLCQQVMYLFLDCLMFYLMELPIYLTMDHLMEHLMELPMDILMDHSTEETINRMGTSINDPLTLLIMAL